ncbi:MAG: hypothetical protein ACK5ME_12100 [Parahaliea sp.]
MQTMQTIKVLILTTSLLLYGLPLSAQAAAQESDGVLNMQAIPQLQRGSEADRRKNRQKLTELGHRIYTRQISYEELKDYLLLGGDPDFLRDYAPDVTWLAGRTEMLLNFFIGDADHIQTRAKDESLYPNYRKEWALTREANQALVKDRRSDRYQSLALLLKNGAQAQPDVPLGIYSMEDWGNAQPLIFASRIGDVEAIHLLVAHGADIKLHDNYGKYGWATPALEAASLPVLEVISRYAGDDLLPERPIDVRSWLDKLVIAIGDTSSSVEPILWRLHWLEERGLRYGYADHPELASQDPWLWAQWKQNYYSADKYPPELAAGWQQLADMLKRMRYTDLSLAETQQEAVERKSKDDTPEERSDNTDDMQFKALSEGRRIQAEKAEKIERGGIFTRMRNRKALRKLSGKIHERTITYEELKNYLRMGGNPTVLSNYVQVTPQWLLYNADQALLNYFLVDYDSPLRYFDLPSTYPYSSITTSRSQEKRSDEDRLKSVQLLLQNGASAEYGTKIARFSYNMSKEGEGPALLNASVFGDAAALMLMLAAGADVNFIWNLDSDDFIGPPLALALDDMTADVIWQYQPNTDYRDKNGLNLLQMVVFSDNHPGWILGRVQWMEKKGLRFDWQEGSEDDPMRRALRGVKKERNTFELAEMSEQKQRDWQRVLELLPRLKK